MFFTMRITSRLILTIQSMSFPQFGVETHRRGAHCYCKNIAARCPRYDAEEDMVSPRYACFLKEKRRVIRACCSAGLWKHARQWEPDNIDEQDKACRAVINWEI
jgi:hypothetical protein